VKKLFVSVGLFSIVTLGLSGSALASPNPNPNARAHAETACANVLTKNANTGPGGHISQTGGAHFLEVGTVLCGLPN
jgi:hypothetical protein